MRSERKRKVLRYAAALSAALFLAACGGEGEAGTEKEPQSQDTAAEKGAEAAGEETSFVIDEKNIVSTGTRGDVAWDMSFQMAEGWLCEVFVGSENPDPESCGMELYPEEAPEGRIEFRLGDSFGGGRKDREETEITLAGDKALLGRYGGNPYWDYIVFQGENSGLTAVARADGEWLAQYGETAVEILDTVQYEQWKTDTDERGCNTDL